MSNTTVLNTLEWAYDWLRESSCSQELLEDIDERITEVKIEMRRSVKQEPVAFIKDRELGYMLAVKQDGATEWNTSLGLYPASGDVPLFTAQPKPKWVGLTEQEVKDIFDMDLGVYESIEETMRRLEEINK